jgi:hypothetical protein
VNFVDTDATYTHEVASQGTPTDVQDFCHLVRHNIGAAKLCLKIHGTQLVRTPTPLPLGDAEYPIEAVPSRSLKDVLREQHLTSRDRIVVAYIIAKSVWRYYNTDWLNALWTTDNIHFMIEQRGDDLLEALAINPAIPYLAFSNGKLQESSISETVNCFVYHRYPRILALGAILVELCRGEARQHAPENETLEIFINNNHAYNSKTIKNHASWPKLDLDETYKTYFRDAVAVCFDWKKLDGVSGDPQDPVQGVDGRRNLLWEDVVSPLQRICRIMNLIDDTGAIIHGSPHVFRRAHLYETMIFDEESTPMALGLQSQKSDILGPAPEVDKPADRWLNEITNSQLARTLLRHVTGPGPSSPKPIRIAILDTGYDANNPFFSEGRKRRIRWRDFTGCDGTANDDSPGQGQDSDGHGTDVFAMALRVAPFAEFCVARVFENSRDVATRVNEIVKVITRVGKEE